MGKPEGTCPSATLTITNLMWTGLGLNPGLHAEASGYESMSHGVGGMVSYVLDRHCPL
jgi:hypothetical protein